MAISLVQRWRINCDRGSCGRRTLQCNRRRNRLLGLVSRCGLVIIHSRFCRGNRHRTRSRRFFGCRRCFGVGRRVFCRLIALIWVGVTPRFGMGMFDRLFVVPTKNSLECLPRTRKYRSRRENQRETDNQRDVSFHFSPAISSSNSWFKRMPASKFSIGKFSLGE